jgi:hypothetical protein
MYKQHKYKYNTTSGGSSSWTSFIRGACASCFLDGLLFKLLALTDCLFPACRAYVLNQSSINKKIKCFNTNIIFYIAIYIVHEEALAPLSSRLQQNLL